MPRPRRAFRSTPRLLAMLLLAGATAISALPVSSHAANIFENFGSGSEFLVDLSVRSQAMGGASGAVFWGQGLNNWANPALLGLSEGIAYEDATTQNFVSDSRAQRWTLGYGGIGLASAGHPFTGLGSLKPYGDDGLILTNEIRSWGLGASLSGLAVTIAGMRGSEAPAFTRFADLAFGYNRKSSEWGGAVGTSKAVAVDWGLLARGTMPFRLGSGGVPARVDAGYGYSVQNSNDATPTGNLFPLAAYRPHRHSVAARFALDLPAGWRERVPGWLAPGFEPLLSLGGAWDREFVSIGSGPTTSDDSHLGGELGLANVAFVRLGHDDIRHYWGYGLALPLGRMAGFQYDRTRRGDVDGFPATWSRAWLLWLNPVEIARALRATR